jgi:hypothetical protein
VNGLHEAIIDDATWNVAQEYMAKNPPRPVPAKYTIKNPLAGLIICGKCGRSMVRRPYSGKYEDTLICSNSSCKNVSSSLKLVEKHLLESLKAWLQEYKLKIDTTNLNNTQANTTELYQKALANLDKSIKTLNKQMNSLHDLLEQGIYTTEIFLDRSKIISGNIQQLTTQKNILIQEIELEMIREENQKNIIPKVERLLEFYESLPNAEAKNQALREILEKAVYNKDVNGRWHHSPEDFELVIYPKLPKEYFSNSN